jgi:hypothetical protein
MHPKEKTMRTSIVLAALLATLWLATDLLAEKVDMPRAGLQSTATHVITGTVKAVYTRKETEGEWRYTRYVAEVKVKTVEKGEGLKPGGLAYVRYWTRSWIGGREMPPSTSGHRGLPEEGETLRIYLARNAYDGFSTENHDGGFNVIGANGFERLSSKDGEGD